MLFQTLFFSLLSELMVILRWFWRLEALRVFPQTRMLGGGHNKHGTVCN